MRLVGRPLPLPNNLSLCPIIGLPAAFGVAATATSALTLAPTRVLTVAAMVA
jgi:hypothetical protein